MAKQSIRHAYGACLVELGREYPELMVLEADLKESTQSIQFEKAFPERYIECGIAEQNMVCVAAGLALAGNIPVAHSFACFLAMRACEQVRTSIAYPQLNVKLVASHAGVTAGSAGTTHHALEDIAIMRAMAGMTVFVPGDVRELRQVLKAALAIHGPVYIRLGAIDYEDVYREGDQFAAGRATLLRQGNDVTIVTTGHLMYQGVVAADILAREHGIQARVLQMASIKPFDAAAIAAAVRETAGIITVEDHNILGGLGGAVCEAACAAGGTRVERIGFNDCYCNVGSCACLLEQEGITVARILERAMAIRGQ